MGNLFTKIFDLLGGKKDRRIVMVGLDAAGKTTVLGQLKLGEVTPTVPTIGFNVDEVEYNKVKMQVWDVGGQDRIRSLWRNFYGGVHAVIYVVDSADANRFEEARTELEHTLEDSQLEGCPLLVLANKQDLPTAVTPAKLMEDLKLLNIRQRAWYVQGTTATTGEGLVEGLEWLTKELRRRE